MDEKHNCEDCFWVKDNRCVLLHDEKDEWKFIFVGPNDCEFFVPDDGSLLSRR